MYQHNKGASKKVSVKKPDDKAAKFRCSCKMKRKIERAYVR